MVKRGTRVSYAGFGEAVEAARGSSALDRWARNGTEILKALGDPDETAYFCQLLQDYFLTFCLLNKIRNCNWREGSPDDK